MEAKVGEERKGSSTMKSTSPNKGTQSEEK